jgi:hypothetical protein
MHREVKLNFRCHTKLTPVHPTINDKLVCMFPLFEIHFKMLRTIYRKFTRIYLHIFGVHRVVS